MRNPELVTLAKAMELKEGSQLMLELEVEEKPILITLDSVGFDSQTKVAFLKTKRGKIYLASEISRIEFNNRIVSKT